MDTIFAQSSKPGKAGVAIFRLSGPKSLSAVKYLLVSDHSEFTPRVMYCKKLISPTNHELIDNAMVAYFQAPASFTGEDVVEIYTHGSIAIATMLTKALLNIEGVRLAEAGEFTRRAFLNNKFDLTAAEGIADLIEAETIWQHRQAVKQSSGQLEALYNSWKQSLLTIISLLEAYIDFPDEEIPQEVLEEVLSLTLDLKHTINKHLNDHRRGELLRSGIKLTILGAPNVGKSSLLNFLMQREVAIVSDISGTTRDVIEGHLDIGGYPIILQDTAGIRTSKNLIEMEGIKRALNTAKIADIKIIMLDAIKLINSSSYLKELDSIIELIDKNTIILVNKIDLLANKTELDLLLPLLISFNNDPLQISIKENIGLNALLKKIENIAHNIAGLTEIPHITRQRQRHQIEKALEYLENFNIENDLVLATEDIRMAIRSLSNVTGKITVEEILGEIFSNFCIGK
ncbi:tRNA uridine-5-carboxymethylaminomethyl(34) synthesis GTPase MnmE [Candidatus Tisiphia endosymbiont of Nemotelus uliginosus]|uniref:tRNA uridine-5-carboxymethylaminomethyl(34) synthesis GTPase MnmE n=1 Tax=Candidatus Tisiphia endosymbiont of Nemotelus uliginosus TaxID=3077926 RepID=UPI0035C93A78